MNIFKIIRLDKNISTGMVFKVLLPTAPGEKEHALHVLVNGSIMLHTHSDEDGISEGYRELNPETGETSEWEVVGAGMSKKSHEVSFKEGIRFIEGSKRNSGIENWPELKETPELRKSQAGFVPGKDFPPGESFAYAIADGIIKYHPRGYVDDEGNIYDKFTGKCIYKK